MPLWFISSFYDEQPWVPKGSETLLNVRVPEPRKNNPKPPPVVAPKSLSRPEPSEMKFTTAQNGQGTTSQNKK